MTLGLVRVMGAGVIMILCAEEVDLGFCRKGAKSIYFIRSLKQEVWGHNLLEAIGCFIFKLSKSYIT